MSSAPPAPAAGDGTPGGRYVFLELLGRGGLGQVWLARDPWLDRVVAIKRLELPPMGRDGDLVRQRLAREARAAARLNHPNIVTVHDVLSEGDEFWIVMEYVPGRSLDALLAAEGTLPVWRAAQIGGQVLIALSAAHYHGIVHRDVKPSNIIVTPEGRAVLTDFGIARIEGDPALTASNMIVGSPGYLAPEILQGEPATPASDMWSLGATLYAAVEGHPPFLRDGYVSTFNATLTEPVPAPRRAGSLTELLLGLLERDPQRRMTPAQAIDALPPVAEPQALSPQPPAIAGLRELSPLGGSVWRAVQEETGRQVAVRVVPTDGAWVIEFAHAVRAAAPEGVVRVLDIGELPGIAGYVVMEYVEQGSLQDRWRALDSAQLAVVIRHVAELNRLGISYGRVTASQVLFRRGPDGERVLLGLSEVPGIDDQRQLADFARRVLHQPAPVHAEAIRKAENGEWPSLDEFAAAIEALPSPDGEQSTGTGTFTLGGSADLLPGLPGLPGGPHTQYPQQGASPYRAPADSTATTVVPVPVRPRRRRFRIPQWWRRRARGAALPAPPWFPPADGTLGERHHSFALYSPLHEPFRYVHEPLTVTDAAIPLLGNERLIRALKERLANSHGGTFLVTGFRGVGKTTLVERALMEIAQDHPRGRRVLPVVLSVARPMPTEKLLFAVVRRVFEELTEAGVLADLPAATRQSLLLAYMRTSLSFKETRSDATERAANVDLDPAKVLKPLAGMIPKAGISTRRTRSLATEAAFLAYSETDVEYDMMRIVRMLSTPAAQRLALWRRLLLRHRVQPLDLQLVVVLDEVDKLTALRDGLGEVERLLSGIKNVVTMRGAHYVVVAGPDLHDQVLKDAGRGNSIYESIFAWRLYVPCSWSAPARLLSGILANPPGDQAYGIVEEFEQYLRFKSRGVPRRLLHELNAFVAWEDEGKPYLRIDSRQYAAVTFYARIERSLDDFFVATRREVLPTPLDQDRWRLSAYYVMDWILRSEGRPFTSADVMRAAEDREFDPLLRVSQPAVELLLGHLAAQQVLDVVRSADGADATYISDVPDAQRTSYKLTGELLSRLVDIIVHDEGERAEHDYDRAPLAAAVSGGSVPIDVVGGRYELRRLVGEGGTSTVYEGRDRLVQRPVAVKLLRRDLRGDPRARARFLREARIAEGVHHPNVVDVYEVVALGTPDTPAAERDYAIVMEYIAAPTLREVVERRGPIPAGEAARTGLVLARALDYLAGKGLARIDLKPHNIVMSPHRGPVIIDLGIARIVDNAQVWLVGAEGEDDGEALGEPQTQLGMIVGTPMYMAPEQIEGDRADIRSDIYALGLVLYTCLAGQNPYAGITSLSALLLQVANTDLDTSGLPCSPQLRGVIGRATARDRTARYQTPAELLADLEALPELA